MVECALAGDGGDLDLPAQAMTALCVGITIDASFGKVGGGGRSTIKRCVEAIEMPVEVVGGAASRSKISDPSGLGYTIWCPVQHFCLSSSKSKHYYSTHMNSFYE